jgi:hypothetical protein
LSALSLLRATAQRLLERGFGPFAVNGKQLAPQGQGGILHGSVALADLPVGRETG